MQLSNKTLEVLRNIINGDEIAHYRSGRELVSFLINLVFMMSITDRISIKEGIYIR
jgi:hypothetical protein